MTFTPPDKPIENAERAPPVGPPVPPVKPPKGPHAQQSAPQLTADDLREMARVRLGDAEVLLAAGRYDGAAYLCGYAVELALKGRICRCLHWPHYRVEGVYASFFKTHELERLLEVSGFNLEMKATYIAEWSVVNFWKPDSMRYQPIKNQVQERVAKNMIEGAKTLVEVL
jgi:HEPN domain-containing protein